MAKPQKYDLSPLDTARRILAWKHDLSPLDKARRILAWTLLGLVALFLSFVALSIFLQMLGLAANLLGLVVSNHLGTP